MRQIVAALVIAFSVLLFLSFQKGGNNLRSWFAFRGFATDRRPSISPLLEWPYRELFSELNVKAPADLVPPLEITRNKILQNKDSDPAKQATYSAGLAAIDEMISVAELRTKTLLAMVKEGNRRAPLDSPTSGFSTGSFFLQPTLKRWQSERERRKVRVDQLLAALREEESKWNKSGYESGPLENYGVPPFAPVYVKADAPVQSSSLERGAYDRREIYPWRSSYYGQYGYRGYR